MRILQNQIGTEGLTAVIEHLPDQYTKWMLAWKLQRAAYVSTLLKSNQHSFIWEYFHPGTIETSLGEERYYYEVMSHISGTINLLKCCMSEKL